MGAAAVPAGIAVAGGAFSAYEQHEGGKASAAYYHYLSDTAKLNEGLSDAELVSARRGIGAEENQQQLALTTRVNETVGTQKAAMVGGVGASSRSAQTIISDTLDKGNLDEMSLRLNADLRARGAEITAKTNALNFGAQAAGYNIAGGNARRAGDIGAISSLTGAAGSVANSWYMGQLYAGRGYGGSGTIGSVQ